MSKEVVVASRNLIKIEATRVGFEKMFPDQEFSFRGESAASGVSNQPMTNEETLVGASNRVENIALIAPGADYWVGIEGGQQRWGQEQMEAFAWVVVRRKDGQIGKSRTATFFLPEQIISLINEGKELGEADDIVFGRTNSKQENGAVGILTGDIINRSRYYSEAVVLALIPFRNPNLYSRK